MKPFFKVTAFLLAVVMIIFSVGCTPISMNAEWSYRYNDQELAIGVYIYSLDQAYSQAKGFAQSNENYSTDKSFMDLEITDDDGNKMIAREWILKEADRITKSILVIDDELKKLNVTVGQATLDEAKKTAETAWNVGLYAEYGYFDPMSAVLEPYGISFDSFYKSSYEAMAKQSALFEAIYGKGGTKAVSDEELTKYFTENYTDYSYFAVNLYTSETNEDGSTKNTAFTDDQIKAVEKELNGYVGNIKQGYTYDDVVKAYMDKNKVTTNPTQAGTEILENSSMGSEIKTTLEKLAEGTATTIKVGEGETAQMYFIYKGKIADKSKTYFKDANARANVVSNMKAEEFNDYIDNLVNTIKPEVNKAQIDRYNPDMFFVPVAPTTEATTTAEETKAE